MEKSDSQTETKTLFDPRHQENGDTKNTLFS